MSDELTDHHHLYCPYCAFFQITKVKQRGDIFTWKTPEVYHCNNCNEVIDLDGLPRLCHYIRDGFTPSGQMFHQFTIAYPPLHCNSCGNSILNISIPCPAARIPIEVFHSELSTWIIKNVTPSYYIKNGEKPTYMVIENHFFPYHNN